MLFPAEIADKLDVPPAQTVGGVARGEDGAEIGFTVTLTAIREAETQPAEAASA
jgi:hypothetical protein